MFGNLVIQVHALTSLRLQGRSGITVICQLSTVTV